MLNYEEAVKWWKISVDRGRDATHNDLAELYEKGLGTSQDFKEAVRLYQIGVAKKDSLSMFHMGRMYEQELGVSKDLVEAYKWYTIALNHTSSQKKLQRAAILKSREKIRGQMTAGQLKQGDDRAKGWKPR